MQGWAHATARVSPDRPHPMRVTKNVTAQKNETPRCKIIPHLRSAEAFSRVSQESNRAEPNLVKARRRLRLSQAPQPASGMRNDQRLSPLPAKQQGTKRTSSLSAKAILSCTGVSCSIVSAPGTADSSQVRTDLYKLTDIPHALGEYRAQGQPRTSRE